MMAARGHYWSSVLFLAPQSHVPHVNRCCYFLCLLVSQYYSLEVLASYTFLSSFPWPSVESVACYPFTFCPIVFAQNQHCAY